jgi:hypothetical protein
MNTFNSFAIRTLVLSAFAATALSSAWTGVTLPRTGPAFMSKRATIGKQPKPSSSTQFEPHVVVPIALAGYVCWR